jgi:hypothetical protein
MITTSRWSASRLCTTCFRVHLPDLWKLKINLLEVLKMTTTVMDRRIAELAASVAAILGPG